MSTPTAAEITALLHSYDTSIRDAITEGTIEETMATKANDIVSALFDAGAFQAENT
jgi:hypothetical protein